jgi:hypothetical protein
MKALPYRNLEPRMAVLGTEHEVNEDLAKGLGHGGGELYCEATKVFMDNQRIGVVQCIGPSALF